MGLTAAHPGSRRSVHIEYELALNWDQNENVPCIATFIYLFI